MLQLPDEYRRANAKESERPSVPSNLQQLACWRSADSFELGTTGAVESFANIALLTRMSGV